MSKIDSFWPKTGFFMKIRVLSKCQGPWGLVSVLETILLEMCQNVSKNTTFRTHFSTFQEKTLKIPLLAILTPSMGFARGFCQWPLFGVSGTPLDPHWTTLDHTGPHWPYTEPTLGLHWAQSCQNGRNVSKVVKMAEMCQKSWKWPNFMKMCQNGRISWKSVKMAELP